MIVKDLVPLTGLPLPSGVPALLVTFVDGLKQLVRAACHHREIAALKKLNPHMLADIGLSHTDVYDAASEPLWRDPTLLLEERVSARRAKRRGTSGGESTY
jgi:uncharacterized protein YjiS (DUF1127 family)